MGDDGENIVSYTVKELLQDIRAKLDQMQGMLSAKVDGVASRVDNLEDKVKALEVEAEHNRAAKAAALDERRYITPVRLTVAWVLLTVVSVFVSLLTAHIHL